MVEVQIWYQVVLFSNERRGGMELPKVCLNFTVWKKNVNNDKNRLIKLQALLQVQQLFQIPQYQNKGM
jgi:hypothetical protein